MSRSTSSRCVAPGSVQVPSCSTADGVPSGVLHDGTWTLPGATHLDEVERLIDHDLPDGDYETVAGLVMAELQRLPDPGDTVEIALPTSQGDPRVTITVTVDEVARRVPRTVSITLGEAAR